MMLESLKSKKNSCSTTICDMAAYAALVSLLNDIQQINNHPHLSSSLDKKQIEPLLEKAGLLLDFIETTKYGGGSKEVEDMERQIASATHAAEDVIESHIVDQIHAGTNETSNECSLHLQQIVEDMDAIFEKTLEVKERRGVKETEEQQQQQQPEHISSRSLMETREPAMVGFEDELIQLLGEITGRQSSRRIISIVGMGGAGKSTLAKTVYRNLLIMQHFDFRAWATVSQPFNVEEILSQLLSGLGKSSDSNVDDLGEQLHKTLSGRRYLIILDDIWSVEVWDKVRRFLPDNGNGSRVVLTTRLSNVAVDCGSYSFTKNLLDENGSWKLFCEKAFQHEDCPPELVEVGKEIVRLCRGLPLSIVVIGGRLLKSPRTVGYWEDVAKEIKSVPDSKEKQESLDVLLSSYNNLPPHLKPCFLYTGVSKRGSEIRVSKIIRLWVAEGFLKPNGNRLAEDIAEDYLKDLIDRNLLLVARHQSNGKLKSCAIHDLLRDLCLKVAEQQEFFCVIKRVLHVIKSGVVVGTVRRFISGRWTLGAAPPLARSVIASKVDDLVLDRHRYLRILEVGNHGSPDELFGCANLRYLAFKLQDLEIPTSVSLPWNLQTLIFIDEYFSSIAARGARALAPIEIWKARQLRHLECSLIHLPSPSLSQGEDGFFILENLQTLKTALNLRLSEEVCKIIPNIKNLNLVYKGKSHGYDDRLIECLSNLDRLHQLESLNLSVEKSIWPDIKLNKTMAFPSSLNKLSLSHCQLQWEDLRMIGSLPQLKVLKLQFMSVFDDQPWSPVSGQFLRLKLLKIHYCYLACWNADSAHFPILEKLVLSNLLELEGIPLEIGEIPTLKLIRVDTCSESAVISAVKIKEDQLDNQGNDDLQIQVKMMHEYLDKLRENVEMEGLTMDNILLETF